MSRFTSRLAGFLFAAFVAAGLGFGATQALATSPSAEPCGDDPWEIGTCTSTPECDDMCRNMNFGPGWCRSDGCCVCAI